MSAAFTPCPFCKSEQIRDVEIDRHRWAVCCATCGAIGPHGFSPADAATRWNTPSDRAKGSAGGIYGGEPFNPSLANH